MLTNLQKARVAAVKTFFCNVEDADTALGVYERLTDMAGADVDADPSTLERPVWQRFCEMTAGDLLDEVEGVVSNVLEAMGGASGSKAVTYTLTFLVEDHGELDETVLRKGVLSGIEFMHQDGALTALDDESTGIESWSITHVSTGDVK